MLTYLNLTLTELDDYFNYDREEGKVYLRRSGKEVTSMNDGSLVSKMRLGDKIITVSIGKLCYFLTHQLPLKKGDRVAYKDGNFKNLRPDNLFLTKGLERGVVQKKEEVFQVDRRIFYNPNHNYYVVRRGKNQAIYRTSSLEEAVSIRNEWESDKTIHRWDKYGPKHLK